MKEPGETLVDARGHRCPVPTLRLQTALGGASPGDLVRLLSDDPLARLDVPHFCATAGAQLMSMEGDGRTTHFLVRKAAARR